MGRRQVVRHRLLMPAFAGSNPAAPANYLSFFMIINMIRLVLFVKLFIFVIIFLNSKAMALEEAPYNVVYQNNIYEIRNYNDRLAIEVNYKNSSSGFRKLFNYIAGSNINSTKIVAVG